jgi:hypothetical protein
VINFSDDKDFGLVATQERGYGQEVIRGLALTAFNPASIEIFFYLKEHKPLCIVNTIKEKRKNNHSNHKLYSPKHVSKAC